MEKITTQQRLKQIMEDRGLKQVDIINKSLPYQKQLNIKMSKNHLSNYINGRSTPDMQRMVLLSKTLGVSPAYLAGFSKFEDETELIGEALDAGQAIFSILGFSIIEKSSNPNMIPDSNNELYTLTQEIENIAFNLNRKERDKLGSIIYNFLLLSDDERDDLIQYSEFVLSRRGYIVTDREDN
ncbi:helix-turn-helix domain-containing protein [Lactococcus sp. DD01]|uniref:helix-turn-helix domain-containing protein n=1 Tax=Lactococcus sp. DD01 TaxID=1776443 RepID=UPI0007760F08|nr:helix-turn-helix domain-containing protein [Lactococcus sp. DD01]KXT62337.1 Phage repressor [Lactococcus sp. DD01]